VSVLHIKSVEEPFRSDRVLTDLALRLLSRAEYVSCLPSGVVHLVLDAEAIRSVGKCLAEARMPASRWTFLDGPDVSAAQWREAVTAMNEQIEMSPQPAGEWGPVIGSLGEDMVAELLGVSVSSVRRYSAGNRATPQDVAERLHFLALLLADLAGSYNDYGIRRWFTRPRAALQGRRPIDALGEGFDPEGQQAQQLQGLAAGLVAAGAA
jgi:uncharacterized protein (DUF2384 family)